MPHHPILTFPTRKTYFPSLYASLDRTQVLGHFDDDDEVDHSFTSFNVPATGSGSTHSRSRDSGRIHEIPHYGHAGCVNALHWGVGGDKLASGGDDKRICIWTMGHRHKIPDTAPRRPVPQSIDMDDHSSGPLLEGQDELDDEWKWETSDLGFGLTEVIYSGHRANIFAVKFAPGNPNKLFSCAGDSEVRVFDLGLPNITSQTVRTKGGKRIEWNEYGTDSGALFRVLKCHSDRVKRIATEDSEDIFLTCSEDGTVRQHDLRVPHVCRHANRTQGGSCPSPLVDYSKEGIHLYSLSVSKLRPYLFAIGGTSPDVYLHDRRMLPKPMIRDWSIHPRPGEQTMCVRRFGLSNKMFQKDFLDKNKGEEQTRRRRYQKDRSVTATKLSDANGRELLVSYSGGPVYIFDIFDSDGEDRLNKEKVKKVQSPVKKRKVSFDETSKTLQSGVDDGDKGKYSYEISVGDDGELLMDVSVDDAIRTSEQSTSTEPQQNQERPRSSPSTSTNENGGLTIVEPAAEEGNQEEKPEEGDEEDEEDNSYALSRRYRRINYPESHIPKVYPKRSYSGHLNEMTVKDVNFCGPDDDFVISGSDDGHFFIWDKETSNLVGIYEGDEDTVNVMQNHPKLPVLAISGIDNTVKLFAPTTCEADDLGLKVERPFAKTSQAEKIIEDNKEKSQRSHLGNRIPIGALLSLLMRRSSADPAAPLSQLTVNLGQGAGSDDDDSPCEVQ